MSGHSSFAHIIYIWLTMPISYTFQHGLRCVGNNRQINSKISHVKRILKLPITDANYGVIYKCTAIKRIVRFYEAIQTRYNGAVSLNIWS